MNRQGKDIDIAVLPTLEARLGVQLASALSEQGRQLPNDISERLRFGREQAVAKARAVRLAAPAPAAVLVALSRHGALSLGSSAPWWQRALGVLPLVVLVSGLLLIQQWSVREQVIAAADIDAVLLADVLPPTAYSDPGFGEYLRSAPP